MKAKRYYLNPHFFLKFFDGKLVLWDYKNHQQYILKNEYFKRLTQIAKEEKVESSPLDQILLDLKLITETLPPDSPWQWDILSQIYHLGVQDLALFSSKSTEEWISDYLSSCKTLESFPKAFHVDLKGKAISLPTPETQKYLMQPLWSVLRKRKTSRNFDGTPISLTALSTILYASFGMIHGEWDDEEKIPFLRVGGRKSYPSGGALHPIEAYLSFPPILGPDLAS